MSCFGIGKETLHRVLDALKLIPPDRKDQDFTRAYLLLNKYLGVYVDASALMLDTFSYVIDFAAGADQVLVPAKEGYVAYVTAYGVSFGAGTSEFAFESGTDTLLLFLKECNLAVPAPAFLFKGTVNKSITMTAVGGTVEGFISGFWGRP